MFPCTVTRPTPVELAQPLGKQGIGDVAERPHRDGAGSDRQGHHRRIGRVHFGIDRRIGQVFRQRRSRGIDRGLHVLRGSVDVAIEHELQRDLAHAERARRCHHLERGDLPEVALERRRDQRRHHIGACARKLGRDLDGWEIHLRQRGDRQPEIAQQPAEHDRHAEQRGRDRTVNEGRRYAHGFAAGGLAPLSDCALWRPFARRAAMPGAAWPVSSARPGQRVTLLAASSALAADTVTALLR